MFGEVYFFNGFVFFGGDYRGFSEEGDASVGGSFEFFGRDYEGGSFVFFDVLGVW